MCIREALLALALIACRGDDACDRAIARINRIENARHQHHLPARWSEAAFDECRAHRPDPVLRCALEAPSDAAAAACIDAFLHDVVGSGSGAAPPAGGKGLNPLLDDD